MSFVSSEFATFPGGVPLIRLNSQSGRAEATLEAVPPYATSDGWLRMSTDGVSCEVVEVSVKVSSKVHQMASLLAVCRNLA